MLVIDGISKKFGDRQALHPLTLEIPERSIFGLLGHNGAGKSTTFGIALGQVHPDAGEVRVDGHSVQHDRARALAGVGAIFESPAFYDYLSGWRNLEIFVSLSAKPDRQRMRECVELVGLTSRIHDPVRHYSHGMRQRLALAQTLLPNPRLILLDEPSEGLDPQGIHEMREMILRLRDEFGLTIVFSSHLLTEVEHLCDEIAILNQGRLIYHGDWKSDRRNTTRHEIEVDDWDRAAPTLTALGCEVPSPGLIEAPPETDIADVVSALVGAGLRVRRVAEVRISLEDFYMGRIRE